MDGRITTIALWGQAANGIVAVCGAGTLVVFSCRYSPQVAKLLIPAAITIAIFTVGAILTGAARLKLESVVASCNVWRMMEAAWYKNSRAGEAGEVDPDAAVMMGLSFAVPVGSLMVSFLGAAALMFLGLTDKPASSLWPAVIAVFVGELIFLTWIFERVAMKSELELLASSWAETQATRPDTRLSRAWARRVIELDAVLR
jgi:hypothetical protein